MASLLDEAAISNLALFRVGVSKTISSLDDVSTEGKLCKTIYPRARDFVLSKAPWPFATRESEMESLDSITFQGWAYAFTLPDGYIRMIELFSGYNTPAVAQRIPHSFRSHAAKGTLLVCNETPVYIIYVARVTAPELFPMPFAEAVAWKMAVDLSMALPVKRDIFDRATQYFKMALSDAVAEDVNAVQEEQPYDGGEIIRARE